MSSRKNPTIADALSQVLESMDTDPTNALQALAAAMQAQPQDEADVQGELEGVTSMMEGLMANLGPMLASAMGELPPDALASIVEQGIPGVDPQVLSELAGALSAPEMAIRDLSDALSDGPIEWQMVDSCIDEATELAIAGRTDEALKVAIIARTRARDTAPTFLPKATLTLGFVYEQAGNLASAQTSYETALAESADNASIAGRAHLALARLFAPDFGGDRRREHVVAAWNAALDARDDGLMQLTIIEMANDEAKAGNVHAAVSRLVEGRLAIEAIDGDAQPLVDALLNYAKRFGDDTVERVLDRIEADHAKASD